MAEFGPLVVGAGRGGTSLLAALLDAHPCLEIGMEAHSAHLLDRSVEPRERVRRYREGCDRIAQSSNAQTWGNKVTTEQIQALEPEGGAEPLKLFFEAFEGIRVIFILRDGRSCVDSKARRAGVSYVEAARRWRFSVEALRYLQPRGALGVTFEQLLADPRRCLGVVCDFLQLPFSERMYGGTASPKLRPEYRRRRIDPSRAAIPRLPTDIYESILDDLRACGYT